MAAVSDLAVHAVAAGRGAGWASQRRWPPWSAFWPPTRRPSSRRQATLSTEVTPRAEAAVRAGVYDLIGFWWRSHARCAGLAQYGLTYQYLYGIYYCIVFERSVMYCSCCACRSQLLASSPPGLGPSYRQMCGFTRMSRPRLHAPCCLGAAVRGDFNVQSGCLITVEMALCASRWWALTLPYRRCRCPTRASTG
jgi:hypothetical protein